MVENQGKKPQSQGEAHGESRGRRRRTTTERVEHLRKTGDKLVEARVREILKDDPGWLRLAAREKEERQQIHRRRLQVTKREKSFENFLDKLTDVFGNLQESQNMDLFHTLCLEEVKCHQEIMRERAAARVRRELNLPDPPLAPPMPPEEPKAEPPG